MNGAREQLEAAVARMGISGISHAFPPAMAVQPLPRVTCSLIIEIVALETGVARAIITGDCRRAEDVDARHLAIWLCHQVTGQNISQIGRAFGGRDHSTVLSALSEFPRRRSLKPDLDARAARLISIIEGALA